MEESSLVQGLKNPDHGYDYNEKLNWDLLKRIGWGKNANYKESAYKKLS
jgi:hypothetical protein